jgi:hypothetical protein
MIPSDQESGQALAWAREALDENGRFWLGNLTKMERELYELDLLTEDERYVAIDIVLTEIGPENRKGPAPPDDHACHGPFLGEKLYAFKWRSKHFQKLMYFKFAIVSSPPPEKLAVYSLHETD